MVGSASLITLVGVVLAGLGLLALWALTRAPRKLDEYDGHLTCPRLEQEVEVTATRDPRTGDWVGIKRCSGFADAEMVTCDRICMHPGMLPQLVKLAG